MSAITTDHGRSKPRVPPLENGDRLTRDEFERRYAAMPKHIKAELVEGVVHMPSPTKFDGHGRPDGRLAGWLMTYQGSTPGTDFGVNATVRLDLTNEPQPDSVLFIRPEHGGQVRLSDDDYIEEAPDLVVEIAATSASVDLGPKMHAYARCGVREYIVRRTLDDVVDWFALRGASYVPIAADATGVLRSSVFPGLWLDVPAAIRRDSAAILATLHLGLQSPEHAGFVAQLQSRASA